MGLWLEIGRVDPKRADELLRLLNELEFARGEQRTVKKNLKETFPEGSGDHNLQNDEDQPPRRD